MVAGHLGYEMPVVLQNLSPSETIHQMLDSLGHLEIVVDDIFNRLTGQVKQRRDRIDAILKRVDTAHSQIETIKKHPKMATKVYSLSRYPTMKAEDIHSPPIMVSGHGNARANVRRKDFKMTMKERTTNPSDVNARELHAVVTQDDPVGEHERDLGEGLGYMPASITSVSSTMLFNSGVNPYKKYERVNVLTGKGGTDREREQYELSAAPTTMADGVGMPSFFGEDYGFKPVMGNVPTFDFNDTLDLGGVADISWGVGEVLGEVKTIAPSADAMASLPDMGDLADANTPGGPPPAPSAPPPSAAPPSGPGGPPPQNAAPPPSSGGGGGRGALLDAIQAGKKMKSVAAGGGVDDVAEAKPKPKKVASIADQLAGIRSGGNLKKAGSRKVKELKAQPVKMDMMSMLKMRLNARNKMMSGKGDKAPPKRNKSAMPSLSDDDAETITSMMPPRPPGSSDDDSGDDSDDWDDSD